MLYFRLEVVVRVLPVNFTMMAVLLQVQQLCRLTCVTLSLATDCRLVLRQRQRTTYDAFTTTTMTYVTATSGSDYATKTRLYRRS